MAGATATVERRREESRQEKMPGSGENVISCAHGALPPAHGGDSANAAAEKSRKQRRRHRAEKRMALHRVLHALRSLCGILRWASAMRAYLPATAGGSLAARSGVTVSAAE
jgi:hypothetical protein